MRFVGAHARARHAEGFIVAVAGIMAAATPLFADSSSTPSSSSKRTADKEDEGWIELEPFSVSFRAGPSFWYSFGQLSMKEHQSVTDTSGGRQAGAVFRTNYHHADNPVIGGNAEVFFYRRVGIGAEGGLSVKNSLSTLNLKVEQDFPIRSDISNVELDSRGRTYFVQTALYLRAVPPDRGPVPGWTLDVYVGYSYFEDDWKDRDPEQELGTGGAFSRGALRETSWLWHIFRMGLRLGYAEKYWGFETTGGIYPFGAFQGEETYFQSGSGFGIAGDSLRKRTRGFAGGEFAGLFLIRPVEFVRVELGYRVIYLHVEERNIEIQSIRHGPTLGLELSF